VTSLETFEKRIARLEAIESIRALKTVYAELADRKYTNAYERVPDDLMAEVAREQAACFTDDAVWQGGAGFGADLVGRKSIEQWFRASPWRFALHFYTAERIDVIDDNTAHATWRLWQIALRDDTERGVLLAAITHERYARIDETRWRISQMKFESLHMIETGANPLPFATQFADLDAKRDRASRTEFR
jgi:hypothetical protein